MEQIRLRLEPEPVTPVAFRRKPATGFDQIRCGCGITGKVPNNLKKVYCKHCGQRFQHEGTYWLPNGRRLEIAKQKDAVQEEAVDRFSCECGNAFPVGEHTNKRECYQCHCVYEKVDGKWLKREKPGMTFGDLCFVQLGNRKKFVVA
jgi:hypothetical protein